jgi:hypothetical protein
MGTVGPDDNFVTGLEKTIDALIAEAELDAR